MSDERPERPGPSKRRAGDQITKDNFDEDENDEGQDPGSWKPVTDDSIKARRKVHVRRGAAPAEPAAAAAAAAAPAPAAGGSNPFAGIALAAPAAAAPSTNPFASISIVPSAAASTAAATDSKPEEKKEDASPAEAKPDNAIAATENDKPTEEKKDSKGTATVTNVFGSAVGGGGFGGLSGGGFGGFGGFGGLSSSNNGGGFGGFAAAATSGGFGSGFNFGSGAFPAIQAKPLAAGGDEGGDEGEGDAEGEGAEANESMALFGNGAVKPVVSLPEQEKRTGEESEQTLFTADAALFEFDTTANKWRERGKGEFKVNVSVEGTTQSNPRMIMRQAVTSRLLLNASVYSSMPVQLMASNVGLTFAGVNAAGNTAEDKKEGASEDQSHKESDNSSKALKTWAIKIKGSDKVLHLQSLLNDMKDLAGRGDAKPGPGAEPAQGDDQA